MKTIAKRIGIKVYNLKNGPFWKQGGAIVERQGHNIVLDCVKIRSHGKNNRVIIEDGVRLHHVKIQISGNDNTIILVGTVLFKIPFLLWKRIITA